MPKYHIWTIGCQMNKAESAKIGQIFQNHGFESTDLLGKADVEIINSCVVRQNAEDKVVGMLGYLKGIKRTNPSMNILVTGCFIDSNVENLKKTYRQVDLFFPPGDFEKLDLWLSHKASFIENNLASEVKSIHSNCCAFVPIIYGCNNFCSYCIVPYRRGRERSRYILDIIQEISSLVKNGVKEITLLGQNVNSYGNDLDDGTNLSMLLNILNQINEIKRIRFLTNHPKDMSIELIRTIRNLDKVCNHLNIPLQSGNDEILKSMRRGYNADHYVKLIENIRSVLPDISLSTDIIVGFPNETDAQFNDTMRLLDTIRFDSVHTAMYSTRPGTIAAKDFEDNISDETKKERFNEVEALQSKISLEINSSLQHKILSILVEGEKGSKLYGRTGSDKLVFFESDTDLTGELVDIHINGTSAWSLKGTLVSR